jgi:hypothetical protein
MRAAPQAVEGTTVLDTCALALCGTRFGFMAGLGFREFATSSVLFCSWTGVLIVFLLQRWLPFEPVTTLAERRYKRILRRELPLAVKERSRFVGGQARSFGGSGYTAIHGGEKPVEMSSFKLSSEKRVTSFYLPDRTG